MNEKEGGGRVEYRTFGFNHSDFIPVFRASAGCARPSAPGGDGSL